MKNKKTCLGFYNAPWLKETKGGVALCKKPCKEGEIWWMEKKQCVKTVPEMWKQVNIKGVEVAKKPYPNEQIWRVATQECLEDCPFPLVLSTVNDISVCK